ncbi:MAG: hypothetical protein CL946_03555 [Ectothiorhodospiraceae bacterium]|nr:hypothetical protein [Ectothiorhodospiraceae bacterium]
MKPVSRIIPITLVIHFAASQLLFAQLVWDTKVLPAFGPIVNVVVTPDGDIFADVGDIGLFRSTDDGNTWIETNQGHHIGTGFIDFTCDQYGVLYLTDQGHRLWRSDDKGENWFIVNDTTNLRYLCFDSENRMYAQSIEYYNGNSGQRVVWSDDGGKTTHTTDIDSISTMRMSITPNGYIYVLAFVPDKPLALYRSTDRGTSWEDLYDRLPENKSFQAMGTDPAGNVYVVLVSIDTTIPIYEYRFVARSTDNGETWEKLAALDLEPPLQLVSIAPGNLLLLYKGTVVRQSTDYGETWKFIMTGLQHGGNRDIAFMPDGRAVVAAYGAIYMSQTPVGIQQPPPNAPIPTSLTLTQSYPNPVGLSAQSAVIEYALPRGGYVSLSVYDLSGRLVQTLVDTHQSPGQHSTAFNTGGLPAGLYIYRLSAEGQTITKKLSLVR